MAYSRDLCAVTLTYVVVASSVVANQSEPPEVVDAQGHAQDVGVVQFVVVANPGSHESPKGLDFGVSSKPCDLLGLSLWLVRGELDEGTY